MAPNQDSYSEALPTQAKRKKESSEADEIQKIHRLRGALDLKSEMLEGLYTNNLLIVLTPTSCSHPESQPTVLSTLLKRPLQIFSRTSFLL